MRGSSRRKNANPPKEKTSKTSAEATSSNPTAQEPPTSLPAVVQPQLDISQSNPTAQITPSATAIDDDELDPEEVIQEFRRKYGKGPKASKFFARTRVGSKKKQYLP